MLSRYSNELARKSTWTCISCAAATRTPQALIASSPNRSPVYMHQRKHSSSKTSSSPKDESRAIATPSETPSKKPKSAAQEVMEKRPSSGASRRKSNNNDLSLNLPSVPSTGHVHPLDIQVSSFFSIHRPISVTTPIPTEQSPATFSSIFEQKPSQKSKTADVIYTLSSAVNSLENAAANTHQQNMTPEEIDLRQAVTQASSSNAEQTTHHLDIPAKTLHINLQELAKNFRPFMPPPVPVPMDDSPHEQQQAQQIENDISNNPNEAHPPSPQPTRKSYTTTLTIHEITSPTGAKTYKTHNTPIIEHQSPSPSSFSSFSTVRYSPPSSPRNQPFLGRMRERQLQYLDRMAGDEGVTFWQLISVKRQRKLKMKKHKYKKLMRRTKNLRRKLDRT